ncbi:MAG: cysteine--tRNA ligase [Deltaproteobacteria bacterium]|nr:cysteine--tRNA ligase [Deltaproteobacteria bacterium]
MQNPPAPETPSRAGALALIGNTPLVRIRTLNPNPKVEIWAKLERGNPGGSVKDRIALWMIEDAERRGELRPGKTIIEATSGNTGIGLALVAAIKRYPLVLAMSEGASVERRKILAAFGAQFLLTPADKGTDGAIERVYELGAEDPDKYYMSDQFNNPANVMAHYHTTAQEIWQQTGGRITHLVVTMGTTGTIMGCSKRFRELDPRVRIIGVEPYLGHKIQGLKNLKEAYVPGIYKASALDEKINIDDEAAYEMARRLARDEGLLVGMSSGAAMHVAVETARQIESGVIVTILPDGGDRYLSTSLFQVAEPDTVPAKLHFFNTLTRRSEAFEPLSKGKEVTMYSCGPTVHKRPHIGLLRRLMADDLVRRTLEFSGYTVKHAVSITDVDDNTVQESERTGESMKELCDKHEAEFHEDLRALAILPAWRYVRSSESVADMVNLARSLVGTGYAYEKLRSVYFNIGRVNTYGELSAMDLGKIKSGATVDLERYDKDDPRDFTLLRRSTLAELRKGVSYKTEWGNVRPSWHVQCSAMARAALGERFDIHMASVDLLFPHNENELAQSRALTGESQARVWLHSELVLLDDGKKASYEEDSYVTLPDLQARGNSPREVRLVLLRTHYRQPVTMTDQALEDARASLRRIDEFMSNVRSVTTKETHVEEVQGWVLEMKEAFRTALYDDLNTPAALAAVFRLVRQINHVMAQGKLCSDCAAKVVEAMQWVDQVLGILPPEEAPTELPQEVTELLRQREEARKSRAFERADEIRQELLAKGFVLEDRVEGTRVRRR